MSAPKDQFQRARVILDSLVQGVHPKTCGTLPEDSIINEIDVSRAMATAVFALDQMSARVARRAQLPESVGKAWTDEEEQQLRGEFGRPAPPARTLAPRLASVPTRGSHAVRESPPALWRRRERPTTPRQRDISCWQRGALRRAASAPVAPILAGRRVIRQSVS